VFERDPLPHGASTTLTCRYDPFAADDLPDLMRQAGTKHQGNAASQARVLSTAALEFLEAHRMKGPMPPGERARNLLRLGRMARQLREAMPSEYLGLFPPDIGHAPAVRALYGITVDMERTNWPAVKAAARAAEEGLFYELPHLLRMLEAAAHHEADSAAQSKRPGPGPDMDRHDFVLRCMRGFEDASGRLGLVTSRPPEGGPRGGPAPRFLAAVCALFLARLHPSELTEARQIGEMLAEASKPEAAALWIEQARNIRAKLRQE